LIDSYIDLYRFFSGDISLLWILTALEISSLIMRIIIQSSSLPGLEGEVFYP